MPNVKQELTNKSTWNCTLVTSTNPWWVAIACVICVAPFTPMCYFGLGWHVHATQSYVRSNLLTCTSFGSQKWSPNLVAKSKDKHRCKAVFSGWCVLKCVFCVWHATLLGYPVSFSVHMLCVYEQNGVLFQAFYFDRDDVALPGAHKFFKKSSDEEREHAQLFMKFQNQRGGRIVLQNIVVRRLPRLSSKLPSLFEWNYVVSYTYICFSLQLTLYF